MMLNLVPRNNNGDRNEDNVELDRDHNLQVEEIKDSAMPKRRKRRRSEFITYSWYSTAQL